ncbi:MAG: hypothetical protein JJT76_05100 [Clostridiaceae bacterium]|nr:hypothetical protein [Clostridiaceae bacterium]
MNLKGKIVTLRAIEEEDLEMLRDIINDPEVERLVVGWSLPISKAQQKNGMKVRCVIKTISA